MRTTGFVVVLIFALAAVTQVPASPCPGDEVEHDFVLKRPAPYLDPEDQDAEVIRNEQQWCEFWGWSRPCDTSGIDFSEEVALVVYLPQVIACDDRALTEVCGTGGRHLKAVVDVTVNRPCPLPAYKPAAWYVVTVDKPVASACTEYIWTFNVQGEPPYTQTYGCE